MSFREGEDYIAQSYTKHAIEFHAAIVDNVMFRGKDGVVVETMETDGSTHAIIKGLHFLEHKWCSLESQSLPQKPKRSLAQTTMILQLMILHRLV